MATLYAARERPPEVSLGLQHATVLRKFLVFCDRNADAEHNKTRALARVLPNDWITFWVVLDYPWLPLPNKEAERVIGLSRGVSVIAPAPNKARVPSRRRSA